MEENRTSQDRGFEQGPIRPPSEAYSLLLRLTRNCPWNHCTFCPVYKSKKFSFRPVDHIIRDIDLIHTYIQGIKATDLPGNSISQEQISNLFNRFEQKDRLAFNAAMNWYAAGMESIFLQDANSLIIKPENLIRILEHIRERFPFAKRITSYARSHTIVRINDRDLEKMARAGLNRIHIGMESGSDRVLARINKGVDKDTHIRAGIKVKQAGMELSEYVMPGLGGIDFSIEHALETASALNHINPEFIRLRTVALIPGTQLSDEAAQKIFEKPTDTMIAKEIRVFLESLNGIDSYIKSDHILNLFETIEGRLPWDKDRMIKVIDDFFDLNPEDQVFYQIGRRLGLFRSLGDMANNTHMDQVRMACEYYGVTPDNVDRVIDELMERFV